MVPADADDDRVGAGVDPEHVGAGAADQRVVALVGDERVVCPSRRPGCWPPGRRPGCRSRAGEQRLVAAVADELDVGRRALASTTSSEPIDLRDHAAGTGAGRRWDHDVGIALAVRS